MFLFLTFLFYPFHFIFSIVSFLIKQEVAQCHLIIQELTWFILIPGSEQAMMDLTLLIRMSKVVHFPVSLTQLHKTIKNLNAAAVCQIRCLLQKRLTLHLECQKVHHHHCYHMCTQNQVRNTVIIH